MATGSNAQVKRLNEHANFVSRTALAELNKARADTEAALQAEQRLLARLKSRLGTLGCFTGILGEVEDSVRRIIDSLLVKVGKKRMKFQRMEESSDSFGSEWDSLSALLQKEASPVLAGLSNVHAGIRLMQDPTVELLDSSIQGVKDSLNELLDCADSPGTGS